MRYEIEFLESALKEWRKLDANTREQFCKKLNERRESPHVPSAKLRDSRDRYKIKLRSVGYRLVYSVKDDRLVVLVIAMGNASVRKSMKRQKSADPQFNGMSLSALLA